MKTATAFAGDAQFDQRRELDVEIDVLTEETRSPRVLVEALYVRERAKLERTAKIKTYVGVLTRRRVKALLQEQRRA
jgi:hypothetical protein